MKSFWTTQVKEILKTATLRKSSITFAGTVLNAIFGAIFYIIAARFLGPSGFGIMTVALMIMSLTTDIGDLGTDTGLVNFVSRYIKDQKIKAQRFLKLGLEVKILAWILVLILGSLSAKYISISFFLKPELETPIIIAFIGVLSLLLFSFVIHALQAMQRFWGWSFIQAGTNFLRLILILLLFYFGFTSVEHTMLIYIAVPMIGFFIGLKMIGGDFLTVSKEWSIAGEFFKYNKWVAAFIAVSAISSRMDTFISARLLDSTEVGIYSAANQMVKIVPQIVMAIGTVIGPKMAELGDFREFIIYFKKTQLFVIMLSLLGLLTIPIVIFFIPHLFGAEYVSSGPVFVVLFISMLIFLISVPVHMAVFYYYSYPKLFFAVGTIHLLLVTIGGWQMISVFGLMGAAYTVLAAQVIDFVAPLYYVLSKIRKEGQIS